MVRRTLSLIELAAPVLPNLLFRRGTFVSVAMFVKPLISASRILFVTNSRHSTSNELRLIMKLTDYKFQIYSRFVTNGI